MGTVLSRGERARREKRRRSRLGVPVGARLNGVFGLVDEYLHAAALGNGGHVAQAML
ncbi:hypothetical protein ACFSLT_08830 [Novosphingobium resinovorum]|jgi:hypothetical protein|uniref:hypothetical protein n=1 Tax=Novosphingobium resinovorum TaxID=158500 RepID=UPI003605B817